MLCFAVSAEDEPDGLLTAGRYPRHGQGRGGPERVRRERRERRRGGRCDPPRASRPTRVQLIGDSMCTTI